MPEGEREFLWVEELVDEKIKTPEILLPFNKKALNDVLQSLKDTLHNNFVAAVLSVGRFNSTYLFSVSISKTIFGGHKSTDRSMRVAKGLCVTGDKGKN